MTCTVGTGPTRHSVRVVRADQTVDGRLGGESLAKLICNGALLVAGRLLGGLREDGGHQGGDDTTLSRGRMHQKFANEMHPTALPGGGDDLARRGLLWLQVACGGRTAILPEPLFVSTRKPGIGALGS